MSCRSTCSRSASGKRARLLRRRQRLDRLLGIDHLLVESDYPHADSTWPDTQDVIAKNLVNLSDTDAAKITHRNAAELFRHPLPDPGWLSA